MGILRPGSSSEDGPPKPLFASRTEQSEGRNPNRSPYFRNQLMQRLSATTTIRSNVYALWITMGKFEVLPNESGESSETSVPDQLGQELGWDVGNIQRHRAFYIIDRSIPVAFQPGQPNNVHRTIMVNRLIE